ncbi:copper ion binding protein [Paenibacillus kobensis]|uniref:copper ion binding protein n=1 Tax=Paenibacillus kobensis TaxID=59841 RepID=UPI001FE7D301|nr:copper ion binding protein [Paenibacillus kobensis]
MTTTKLQVAGMSCQHCVRSIEQALQGLGGSAAVELETGMVEVTFDETSVTLEQVKEAIEEQGYDVA